jgi:hypothetical protein
MRFFRNKGPEFIKFQDIGVRLSWIGINQGRSEWWKRLGFFSRPAKLT